MKPSIWRRIYDAIGELLYAKELDAIHDRAFRAGMLHAFAKMKFDADTKMMSKQMTKTEIKGYQRCLDQIDITKSKIIYTTGSRD